MELGLSLGDPPKPPFGFIEKHQTNDDKPSAFCMDLSIGPLRTRTGDDINGRRDQPDELTHREQQRPDEIPRKSGSSSSEPPVQLDLLPHAPGGGLLELNRVPKVVVPTGEEEAADETAALSSSPNSNSGGTSSFQMDIGLYSYGGSGGGKRDQYSEGEAERASSRASDEDDVNGNNRKKLRLSKEQSAFLEESFKEHNTLNPKQKLALAKQLNLRPRQVEVWFQNRRARTKLKQTEVDCEYLKRCCETLTEENRRLHKELQELRALKTSNPFYMQLPATTLTMCPSCERVATTTTTAAAAAAAGATTSTTTTTTTTINPSGNNNESSSKSVSPVFPLNRPKFYPFPQAQNHSHQSS
ncbi:Octamer-binding transcription factor [Trema orientale]|uniref:Octamer-binding transcription factor n=1 Tax=Trema orientale TaxID=63057 RepID=A0A2P5EAU7_TREOI|nr:Octamer-binding transcription factor [Trema orientale]